MVYYMLLDMVYYMLLDMYIDLYKKKASPSQGGGRTGREKKKACTRLSVQAGFVVQFSSPIGGEGFVRRECFFPY